MRLELTITGLPAGTPFAGVAVYVWHRTRDGGYVRRSGRARRPAAEQRAPERPSAVALTHPGQR